MASSKKELAEQVEEAPAGNIASERTQEWFGDLMVAHSWTLHPLAKRWYPPLEDGTPHLPDDDGKPAVNTTKFIHMSDVNVAIEHNMTDELVALIVKWGKPVAG